MGPSTNGNKHSLSVKWEVRKRKWGRWYMRNIHREWWLKTKAEEGQSVMETQRAVVQVTKILYLRHWIEGMVQLIAAAIMPCSVSTTPISRCLLEPSNQRWAGFNDASAHKRLEENFMVTTLISYQWPLWLLPLKSDALCPFSERCPWFFNNFLNVGFQDRFAREHISVVGSNYQNRLLIIHYFVYTMLAVWLVFPSLVCGL